MNAPGEPIAEELLYAYVDGEADAAIRAQVEAAMERDPAVAARIAQHRALQARLHAGFADVLAEPVPARLQNAMHLPSRGRAWREWGALAATLLLGTLIGTLFSGRSSELPVTSRAGQLLASDALGSALDSQLSGTAANDGRFRVALSIRTSDGEYCRSFQLAEGQAGLACRRDGAWVVDVLAASPAGAADYRQAASPLPDAVRMAIEARAAGEPLSSEEERAQRDSRWQATPVPTD